MDQKARAPANGLLQPGPLSVRHPEYLSRKLSLDRYFPVGRGYYAFTSRNMLLDQFLQVASDRELVQVAYAFFNDRVVLRNNGLDGRAPTYYVVHSLYEPMSRLLQVVRSLSDFCLWAEIVPHPVEPGAFSLFMEFPETNEFSYTYFLSQFRASC